MENSMKNDFEDSVFKKFPEIAAIKMNCMIWGQCMPP